MANVNTITVRFQMRYIGWTLFVLRVAKMLWRIPGGKRLARLVYGACWFQFRMRFPGGPPMTRWQWFRVPFPVEQKVSATYGG